MKTVRQMALDKLQKTQRIIARQIDKAHKRESISDVLHLEEQYRQIALRIELLKM